MKYKKNFCDQNSTNGFITMFDIKYNMLIQVQPNSKKYKTWIDWSWVGHELKFLDLTQNRVTYSSYSLMVMMSWR